MPGDFFFPLYKFQQLIRDFIHFNRGDTNSLQLGNFLHHALHQLAQTAVDAIAVASGMDAAQHDFPMAAFAQTSCDGKYLILRQRALRSACKRYDTIAAKLIAAVLYFQKSPCLMLEAMNRKRLKHIDLADIMNELLRTLLSKTLLNHIRQSAFSITSQQNINIGILLQLFACRLCIAADNGNQRLRIQSDGRMNFLTGFTAGRIGHGTGVDDIDIRFFFKGYLFIALFQQGTLITL